MTKVIFRKFKNEDVIALFPDQAGTMDATTCNSYMHVGQHGASSEFITNITTLATPEEYKDLYEELVSIGYDDLKIVKKMTHKDYETRWEQVENERP